MIALVLAAMAVLLLPLRSVAAVRVGQLSHHDDARPAWSWRIQLDDPRRTRRWAVVLAASAAVVVGMAARPVLGLCAAIGVLAAVVGGARVWGARAQEREYDALAEVVGALGGELRAGRGGAEALEATARVVAGPVGSRLRAAASAVRLGADPVESLDAPPIRGSPAVEELRSRVLMQVGAAWRVSAETGAPFADVLDRVEESVQADREHRRRVAAGLAGPRATAALLAALPVLGIGLGIGMGADPVRVLTTTGAGQLALLTGAVLDCVGLWWTGRIVRRAERAA